MSIQPPLWVRLRFVSNSTAAKATILVPVIGYLILFNQSVVEFLNLAKDLDGYSGASVSYRLILIYLGLCGVSVGVLIYGYYCPNEVKHYGAAASYVAGDGPTLRGWVIEEIERKVASNPEYNARREEMGRVLQRPVDSREEMEKSVEKYRLEILHLYFDFMNRSHPWARAFVVVFYALGFGLLAIPSFQVFYRVMKILFKMS